MGKEEKESERERCVFFFFLVFFLCLFMLHPRIEVRSVKWVELNRLFNRKSFLHCCWRLFLSLVFALDFFPKHDNVYYVLCVWNVYVRREEGRCIIIITTTYGKVILYKCYTYDNVIRNIIRLRQT